VPGWVGRVIQMPQSGSVPQVGADAMSGERAARQWQARSRARVVPDTKATTKAGTGFTQLEDGWLVGA